MASNPVATSAAAVARADEDRYTVAMSVQLQILTEMRLMNERNRKIHAQAPLKSEKLWNFLLQFFGLLAAFSFGVFAILAWRAAERANRMANYATEMAVSANEMAFTGNSIAVAARADATVANQLALIARCEATPTRASEHHCSEINAMLDDEADYSIVFIANNYFDLSPNERPEPSQPPEPNLPDEEPSRTGLIAGIAVGGFAGLVLLCGAVTLPYMTYRAHIRRAMELDALAGEKK